MCGGVASLPWVLLSSMKLSLMLPLVYGCVRFVITGLERLGINHFVSFNLSQSGCVRRGERFWSKNFLPRRLLGHLSDSA